MVTLLKREGHVKLDSIQWRTKFILRVIKLLFCRRKEKLNRVTVAGVNIKSG